MLLSCTNLWILFSAFPLPPCVDISDHHGYRTQVWEAPPAVAEGQRLSSADTTERCGRSQKAFKEAMTECPPELGFALRHCIHQGHQYWKPEIKTTRFVYLETGISPPLGAQSGKFSDKHTVKCSHLLH